MVYLNRSSVNSVKSLLPLDCRERSVEVDSVRWSGVASRRRITQTTPSE